MNRILDRLGSPPEGYGRIFVDNTPAENLERRARVINIGQRYISNIADKKKITGAARGYWRFEEPWFREQASQRTYMGLNGG